MSEETKFKDQVISMMKRISDILGKCFVNKLTDINNKGLLLAIGEIEKKSVPIDMIEEFIRVEEHWSKALDRDLKFITETLPELYKSDYIDTKVLTIPITVLETLRKTGFNAKKEEDWPVRPVDEQALWVYLKNMVTLACRYLNKNPKKTSQFPGVSVETYVEKYGIKLT